MSNYSIVHVKEINESLISKITKDDLEYCEY